MVWQKNAERFQLILDLLKFVKLEMGSDENQMFLIRNSLPEKHLENGFDALSSVLSEGDDALISSILNKFSLNILEITPEQIHFISTDIQVTFDEQSYRRKETFVVGKRKYSRVTNLFGTMETYSWFETDFDDNDSDIGKDLQDQLEEAYQNFHVNKSFV